jgi:hypothetical protein
MPIEAVAICNYSTLEPTPMFTETEASSSNTSAEGPCFFSQPLPEIIALLLHENRLTIIASLDTQTYSSQSGLTSSTKFDVLELTIRIYDVFSIPSDGSSLRLIATSEKPIKASYNTALSNNGTVILAVSSSINTYTLTEDLLRFHPQYCGLSSTEYTKLATDVASNLTETFIENMLEELQVELDDGTCDNIVQVSVHLSARHESLISVPSYPPPVPSPQSTRRLLVCITTN